MIISYDGRQYPFDMDEVTIQQALKIEKFMGCSFDEWGKKLQAGDLQARQALGWLILHPAGRDEAGLVKAIEDTDFKMVALGNALNEAFAAKAAAGAGDAETGPTVPAAASNGHALAAAASSPVSSPPSSDVI